MWNWVNTTMRNNKLTKERAGQILNICGELNIFDAHKKKSGRKLTRLSQALT